MTATVLCCPANPHPDAMAALSLYAPQAETPDVADDKFAYWREIRTRWTGERDLIIIEQDIKIESDTIRSLEECDHDWCCFAYPIFRRQIRLRVGLGCTKFSAAAQKIVTSRAISEGFELCRDCKGAGCWWHLDGRIAAMLKDAGYEPHVHGDVTHLHDYQTMEAEVPENGWPLEWFFEEGTDPSPARRVTMDPIIFAVNSRQAAISANEIAEMAAMIAADPSLAVPIPEDDPCYPQMLAGHRFPIAMPMQYPEAKAWETDKVAQGYMNAYREIADYLGSAARVCEVGVLNGGSLATWQELFPQGTVAGVDISEYAIWPEGTIKIVTSQDNPELPEILSNYEIEWDLIVDDASHDGTLTAATLELLWPLVSPGGFYVVEDWFVGYPDYSGPCKSPEMLDLAKSLLDRLHRDSDVASIGYRYGMAIIRKAA